MDEDGCCVNFQYAKLLLVSRIVGAAPVHLTRVDCGYIVTVSYKYVICSSILNFFISAFSMFVTFSNMYITNNREEPTIITYLFDITQLWNLFYLNLTIILVAYSGRKRFNRIIKYLRKINEINVALGNEYIGIKLKSSASMFWMISTFTCIGFFITIVIFKTPTQTESVFEKSFLRAMYGIICFIVNLVFLVEMQYIFVLCLIKATMDLFKRRLRFYFREGPLSFRSIAAVRTNAKHAFRVYVSICDLLADFNNEDGAMIFSFIMFHISNLISHYAIQYLCISSNIQVLNNYVTNVWFWIEVLIFVYNFLRFVIFVEACYRVDLEEVRQLVSELVATSETAHAHLKCFQMNMLLHEPVFAPFGLFEISRTLIPVILGGLASLSAFFGVVNNKFHGTS